MLNMAKDDLKDLPPEERIRILKKLEEEKKKEIAEAEKAIKESQDELTERRKWAEKVPIPQVSRDDFRDMSLDEAKVQEAHKGKKSKSSDSEEKETKEKSRAATRSVLLQTESEFSITLLSTKSWRKNGKKKEFQSGAKGNYPEKTACRTDSAIRSLRSIRHTSIDVLPMAEGVL